MKDFRSIIENEDVFIVAEIGVNYYDIAEKEKITIMEAAKKMIVNAQLGGANAVKFQSYKAELLASRNAPAYWNIDNEPTKSQFELFKKYDSFGKDEYKQLCDFCTSKNIIFLSTPFDFEAVDYLYDLVPIYKISSSDITNLPLIDYIAKKGKPIFLSTGAATLGEIEEAISAITSTGNNNISLLHCILDYPTHYQDLNLNMIKYLKKIFSDYLIGFSDHSKPDDSMLITTLAYVYGAKIIEKHFTLDKSLPGNDHYHAMDLNDLKKLRNNIKFIKKISGQYHKRPLECEKESRLQARRSIVARVNINKGELITREKVVFKRPGTGISPSMLNLILGGIALEDLKEDEILTFDKIRLVNKK
jgi:N-acetylneuraminate synthase